jgi:hypothetical protein
MGINQVLNKIAKINETTELASHQIELTLVDDIQKMYNDAGKELTIAGNASKKAIAIIDEVFTAYRQNGVKSTEALNKIGQFKTQAKTLGLEIPSNILKFESDLTANVKNSQAKMAAIQNAKKQF